jgi:hypothetical protein
MKKIKLLLILFFAGINYCSAQKADTVKHYLIITAADKINAYFNDRPIQAESVQEFNDYVQANAKVLKNASVVITGKPKTGTFDDVLKILSRYRIKQVVKNISPN